MKRLWCFLVGVLIMLLGFALFLVALMLLLVVATVGLPDTIDHCLIGRGCGLKILTVVLLVALSAILAWPANHLLEKGFERIPVH